MAAVLESEQPGAFRVPVSVGEVHPETDKSGQTCLALEVIVNSHFYASRVADSELFRTFLVLVAVGAVQNKHGIVLDQTEWIPLKNRKAVGEVRSQNIRKQPANPLVEVIGETTRTEQKTKTKTGSGMAVSAPEKSVAVGPAKTIELMPAEQRRNVISEASTSKKIELMSDIEERSASTEKEPGFRLVNRVNSEGKPILEAKFQLPEVVSATEIELNIEEDRIVLRVPNKYHLDTSLPVSVWEDRANSDFDPKCKVMNVSLPCKY